jgi:hypothetical protein
MDRRVLFFVGAAAACVLLVPVAPDEFRTVCWIVAIVYLVMAAAAGLDSYSRNHAVRRPHPSFKTDAQRESVGTSSGGSGGPVSG